MPDSRFHLPPRSPMISRRIVAWTVAVAAFAAVAFVAAALIPGSHASGDSGLARHDVAHVTATTVAHPQTAVVGSAISARDYGTKLAEMQNGVDSRGQLISSLSPIPSRRFRGPIAAYRRYAAGWATRLHADAGRLVTVLRDGDRAPAEHLWSQAFSDYLHLGATYGLLPADLDARLAGLPTRIGSRHFVGLHRIEMGLWTGEPPRSLVGLARGLSRASARLPRTVRSLPIAPLDYATRAHEILEDAQRDLLSGTQVPWSHAGVLGTAAGVAATTRVVRTLTPLLGGRENALELNQYWLARLNGVLRAVRRPDGSYPTLSQLAPARRLRLNATLQGALGALEQLPGALETTTPTAIPDDPARP